MADKEDFKVKLALQYKGRTLHVVGVHDISIADNKVHESVDILVREVVFRIPRHELYRIDTADRII